MPPRPSEYLRACHPELTRLFCRGALIRFGGRRPILIKQLRTQELLRANTGNRTPTSKATHERTWLELVSQPAAGPRPDALAGRGKDVVAPGPAGSGHARGFAAGRAGTGARSHGFGP